MAVFKCKMCSGELEITEGITVVECEYCGTKQTVPTAKDENLHSLFNRANTLRIKGEFDKAEKIYEKIIGADETQAEAYWGLILCKYGIEYVEDPATFKRVPTCHRASFDSIVADNDYKTALKYADGVQRGVYESEAVEIDRIQKEILALSQKEEPYDVFICYKETDETGRRTQDSVIANDIYYQLTQEGFKVFYAAITLEDKLGSAYEPCIFAALNSAKVMLVIGTKPEYFNAVWVKNEWSRYLKLIKTDRSRILIPCYRDMDAYELPEEFSHLQAQDMSKIGFINDVVRGIKKVIVKDEPVAIKTETVVTESAGGNVTPLLERAFMFLEDGDFASADEYCEKVLDIDPKCAMAYLGKLMAELKVRKRDDLKNCAEPFDKNSNYQKTIRFGDEKLVNSLNEFISFINDRNYTTKMNGLYDAAVSNKNNAKTEAEYIEAAKLFQDLGAWKNSLTLSSECHEMAETARKDAILNNGIGLMNKERISSINEAVKVFESISGWKNADELIDSCHKKIEQLKAEEEQKKAKTAKNKKKIKKISIISAAAICVVVVLTILVNSVIIPNIKYNQAVELLEASQFDEAYTIFCSLGDYKDSGNKAFQIKKDSIKNCKIGEYIKYGAYEQDNDISNGPEEIEWLILDKKDDKLLVISRYLLDCQPFNTNYTSITWTTCSLRNWLNNDFIYSAFSDNEKANISKVDSQSNIFLLNADELDKYFPSAPDKKCAGTAYAVAQGILWRSNPNDNSYWWLRDSGKINLNALCVDDNGEVSWITMVDSDYVGVRPAMWISLD